MANIYLIDDSKDFREGLEPLLKKKLHSSADFYSYDSRNYNDKIFIEDLMRLKKQKRNFEKDLAIIDIELTISDFSFWRNLGRFSNRMTKKIMIFHNENNLIHGDNVTRAIRKKIDSRLKIASITSWTEKDLYSLRGEDNSPFQEDKYYRHFQKKGFNEEDIANDIISFYYEAI